MKLYFRFILLGVLLFGFSLLFISDGLMDTGRDTLIGDSTGNICESSRNDKGYLIGDIEPEITPSSVIGTSYYVAKAGSDSNPGTEAQPWKTIQKAASVMIAGDTVYVKSGIYNEQVVPANSGKEGSWITYKAYPGHEAVIDGTGLPLGQLPLFAVYSKQYIIVDGFEIRNSYPWATGLPSYGPYPNTENSGIGFIQQNDHLKIRNNYVHHIYGRGIAVGNYLGDMKVRDVEISNNEVAFTNYNGNQEAISVSGLIGYEISNNFVHDIQGEISEIIQVQKEGICVKGASKNGLIYGNLVDNAAVGIYVGGRDSHTKIYGNVIRNCVNGIAVATENIGDLFSSYFDIYHNVISNTYNGIALDLGFGNPVEHITISNNTIYDFYRGIHLTSSRYSDITINNNILYAIRDDSSYQYGIYGIFYDSFPTGVTIGHNLFFNSAGKYASETVIGDNPIMADPQFIDLAVGDFHLSANSPAIDKGKGTSVSSEDFDGIAYSGSPDIGAHEYSGESTLRYPGQENTAGLAENP